jgi:UDP-N-acetylglucosamine:LPS N-acetylglucosamine transferase
MSCGRIAVGGLGGDAIIRVVEARTAGLLGAPRVLILTASVGEGHDLPARFLADGLRAAQPDVEIEIVDGLAELGAAVAAAAESGMRASLSSNRLRWLFDVEYFLFARFAPSRWIGQRLLYLVAGNRLLRAVERRRPDVVVSTYPVTTQVLGDLRARGRLRVPTCSAITDLAALRYWSHPGIDLHLVTHPESVEEVERIAPGSRIAVVRRLNDPAFLSPPTPADARRSLELPVDEPVVAVSGGGWGVGDLSGAVRTALAVDGTTVLCLSGRNDELRNRMTHEFGNDTRVRVLGFVERFVDVLAAADVLVHSTAGLTVFEANLVGCRAISYGWGGGHIRLNNEAFARYGVAEVVTSRDDLRAAIERALATPRRPRYPEFATLPDAATLVLELTR